MNPRKKNKKQIELNTFQKNIDNMHDLEAKDKKSKNILRRALRLAYNELEKRVEERTDYLMMINKNLKQEIDERTRAEELLHYRIELEKLIATLSSHFIKLSSDEIPFAIISSLQTIGEFLGVDYGFVLLFSDNEKRVHEMYKWCRKGIRFPFQNLKGCLIADKLPWLLEKIKRYEAFHAPCSYELPSEEWKEKKYFGDLKMQSCIFIPMFFGTSIIGFVGFNSIWTNKTWEIDILELLRIIGEIFANAIERKKMEDSHRKTEKKYQLLFDHTSEGIAILDKNANILDCNTAYTKFLGFSREEIIGKQASNFFKDNYKKQFAHVLRGDQIDSELRILGKNGTNISLPFLCKLKTICDENEDFTLSLIQCQNIENQDISDQIIIETHRDDLSEVSKKLNGLSDDHNKEDYDKKIANMETEMDLQDLLQKQRKLKENILGISAEGFYVADIEGNIIETNPSFCNLLGYSNEEMLSLKVKDIEIQKTTQDLKGHGKKNGLERFDALYRSKNGKILPVNISLCSFSCGKDTFFIFSVIDITNDKQIEKKIQFLSNAVNQSTDGVAFVDLDGYILFTNQTFANIHGYGAKELIRKHITIFYPPSLKYYLETSETEMKIKGEFKGEVWHARQDNTMFPAAVHKSIIRDKAKNPIGYLIIVNDISKKRELDKGILKNEGTEKGLINAFTELVILIDKDGTILELNERASKDLGKSSNDLLNQSLYDLIPPRLALSNKESIEKALKLAKPVFSDKGLGKSKGETSYCPILNEEGKVVKLAIISREKSGYAKNNNAAIRQNDNPLRIQGLDSGQDFSEQSFQKKEGALKDLFVPKHTHNKRECSFCFEGIISRNPKMWELFEILPSIAESVSTVLIQGESGTGKYLFASAIHNLSPRKNKPFITVNCGALPETLLESELFGYKAGAFTDARKDKPGRFALADGGTLFLDEIGDISPAMQVRLLRFLQERVYEPLGSIESLKADVRIISATNKDLETLVKEGKFRDDLFYRINVVKLDLPPLRERLEDVPLLITDILNKLNKQNGKKVDGVTEDALMCLLSYDFPGNVRELENIIEGAIVLCKSGKILPGHLPKHLSFSLNIGCASSPIQKMETAFLMNVLKQNNWNRIKTARQLGIHKTTLFRKIKALGIKIPASGRESDSKSNV